MKTNNIFRIATGELSQDALLCWLLRWADQEYEKHPLHQLGIDFVRLLTGESELQVQQCEAYRQWNHIDVFCIVNKKHVLVIEDKVGTNEHSDQLNRYKELVVSKDLGLTEPVFHFVYVQTGDQSNYSGVEASGYRVFTRAAILKFFADHQDTIKQVNNDILNDYVAYLNDVQRHVESFRQTPIDRGWDFSQWSGFFSCISSAFPNSKWMYVANPTGGFMCFLWHWTYAPLPIESYDYSVYLQIECSKLCIKADMRALSKAAERRHLRGILSEIFVGEHENGIHFKRPERFGNGKWITLAVDDAYRITDDKHIIDIDRTIKHLQEVTACFDRILSRRKSAS